MKVGIFDGSITAQWQKSVKNCHNKNKHDSLLVPTEKYLISGGNGFFLGVGFQPNDCKSDLVDKQNISRTAARFRRVYATWSE